MINYLNQQLKFKNRSPPFPDYSKTPIINRARVTWTFTPTTENYCKVSMKSMKTFWDMMTNIPIGRNDYAMLWETPKFMPIKKPVTCTSTHTTTDDDHYWKCHWNPMNTFWDMVMIIQFTPLWTYAPSLKLRQQEQHGKLPWPKTWYGTDGHTDQKT